MHARHGTAIEDLLCRAVGKHTPVADERQLVGHATGEAHLMRHEHELRAQGLEFSDHFEHLGRHFGIECRGRLIEKQPARPHDERPQDRDPLLLAAREFRRPLVGVRGELESLERLAHAIAGCGRGEAMHVDERQQEVVERREMRKQIVGLEHGAHGLAIVAQGGLVAGQGLPVKCDAAGRRHVEPGEDPQQCRLATTRGAHEHERLDVAGGEREAVEHGGAVELLHEVTNVEFHDQASKLTRDSSHRDSADSGSVSTR